jgi:hypothetical protein
MLKNIIISILILIAIPIYATPIKTHTGPYAPIPTYENITIKPQKISGVSCIENAKTVTLKSGTTFEKTAVSIIKAKDIHIDKNVSIARGAEVRLKAE